MGSLFLLFIGIEFTLAVNGRLPFLYNCIKIGKGFEKKVDIKIR